MCKYVVGVSLIIREGVCAFLSLMLAPKLVSALREDLVFNLTGSLEN